MKWSDGQPLTSEDVAYTFNRRAQGGVAQLLAFTAQLARRGARPDTVVIHQLGARPEAARDGRLHPAEAHLGEVLSEGGRRSTRARTASPPARSCSPAREGAVLRDSTANPNYWRGKPKVDKVVFRNFSNADAMAAALKNGEIDAVENVPGTQFHQLEKDPKIQTIQGYQGGDERVRPQHRRRPRRSRTRRCRTRSVRQAIAHAIDKKTIVSRVLAGLGKPAEVDERLRRTRRGARKLPEDKQMKFDLDRGQPDPRRRRATRNRRRRHPHDARRRQEAELPLPRAHEGDTGESDRRVHQGWLKEIGIGDDRRRARTTALTEVDRARASSTSSSGAGRRTWTPTAMVSYFTCDQVPAKPRTRRTLQRRVLVRPGVRPAVQAAEGRARRGQARATSSTRRCSASTTGGATSCSTCRTRAGLPQRPVHRVRAPAGGDRAGHLHEQPSPILRERSSPVGGDGRRSSDDGGGGSGGDHRDLSSASSVASAAWASSPAGADRRRARVSRVSRVRHAARCSASLASLVFVLCFNFFLFRVVEADPVGNLFRGRNVVRAARTNADEQFGLDKSMPEQFVELPRADRAGQPRHLVHDPPAGGVGDRAQDLADDRARRASRRCSRRSSACSPASAPDGEDAARSTAGSTALTMFTYAMPDFCLGILLLPFFAFWLGLVPDGRHRGPELGRDRRWPGSPTRRST